MRLEIASLPVGAELTSNCSIKQVPLLVLLPPLPQVLLQLRQERAPGKCCTFFALTRRHLAIAEIAQRALTIAFDSFSPSQFINSAGSAAGSSTGGSSSAGSHSGASGASSGASGASSGASGASSGESTGTETDATSGTSTGTATGTETGAGAGVTLITTEAAGQITIITSTLGGAATGTDTQTGTGTGTATETGNTATETGHGGPDERRWLLAPRATPTPAPRRWGRRTLALQDA